MEEYICPKVVIGCDPSYTHFGLSIINRINKTIKTYDIEKELGSQEFYNIAMKAKEQVNDVKAIISSSEEDEDILSNFDTVIGMENALPFSYNATSLTALDVLLYHELNPVRTAVFNPTYLSFLMGKHTKKDSINLAKALISIFERHGYQHVLQAGKKLTDGEAESFIYACRMLCMTSEDDIVTDILDLQPLFAAVKEKFSNDFIYNKGKEENDGNDSKSKNE